MRAKNLAMGGVLAGAALAVLYLGSATRLIASAACVVAGVITATPIAMRKKGMFWKLYFVTAALSVLLLPSKAVALMYCLLTGVYPATKYYVEAKTNCTRAWILKIVYWNAFTLLMMLVARYAVASLLAGNAIAEYLGVRSFGVRMLIVIIIMNAAFVLYDFVLTRCGDVLRYFVVKK